MMPYKATGKRVYVKRRGKWRLLKEFTSAAAAARHARALNANVKHK